MRPTCPTCGSIDVVANERSGACMNSRCENVNVIMPKRKFRVDPSSGDFAFQGFDHMGEGGYRRKPMRYEGELS